MHSAAETKHTWTASQSGACRRDADALQNVKIDGQYRKLLYCMRLHPYSGQIACTVRSPPKQQSMTVSPIWSWDNLSCSDLAQDRCYFLQDMSKAVIKVGFTVVFVHVHLGSPV